MRKLHWTFIFPFFLQWKETYLDCLVYLLCVSIFLSYYITTKRLSRNIGNLVKKSKCVISVGVAWVGGVGVCVCNVSWCSSPQECPILGFSHVCYTYLGLKTNQHSKWKCFVSTILIHLHHFCVFCLNTEGPVNDKSPDIPDSK